MPNLKTSHLLDWMSDASLQQRVALTLGHVQQEFPHSTNNVFDNLQEMKAPSDMHAIFYGSFDWHSCVHSYWLLARALERAPEEAYAVDIIALFNEKFTEKNVAKEMSFLSKAAPDGFERPYGWAWLLALVAQLQRSRLAQSSIWSRALQPMADLFEQCFCDYLPKLRYPIRTGQHNNTAFALLLALDYAQATNKLAFASMLKARALHYYRDVEYFGCLEPSGEDFLSASWQQALLMQRVMSKAEFQTWFKVALPSISKAKEMAVFTPVDCSDRSDGRLAHLDGLNLSRAWCMTSIAHSFADESPEYSLLMTSAYQHFDVSARHTQGHYMGEHWLSTFLFLALAY